VREHFTYAVMLVLSASELDEAFNIGALFTELLIIAYKH
jgi:hypothetical protein